MIHKLLAILLPVVLPFALYWIGLKIAQSRRAAGETPGWERTPWFLLSLSAGVLLIVSLLFYRAQSGVEPGVKMNPPSFVDGEVKPAHEAE